MTVTVRTVAVDEPFGLVASLATENGFVWMRAGDGIVGWGEAVRLDPGSGPRRFARAAQMLEETFGSMEIHDDVSDFGT
ncbi:MAG: isochorismate synthase, partial [Actinobacteria bacterium]|nr:isochorismate synthase [Actinomycetota bacterium]